MLNQAEKLYLTIQHKVVIPFNKLIYNYIATCSKFLNDYLNFVINS